MHTGFKTIVSPKALGAVAFAVKLVAAGILSAGMGRKKTVETVRMLLVT